MIGKILFLLKKAIGQKEYIEPICDRNKYADNMKSVTGNSLSGANVVVLTNDEDCAQMMNEMLKSEHSYGIVKLCTELISKELLTDSISTLIGPCTHLINVLKTESCDSVSIPEMLYRWLQEETDFFICREDEVTVTSLVLCGEAEEEKMRIEGVCSLIKGLGTVLATHKIVENGVVASAEVSEGDALKTALYLNGKYGQILCGECIRMDTEYGKFKD